MTKLFVRATSSSTMTMHFDLSKSIGDANPATALIDEISASVATSKLLTLVSF